MKLSVAGVSERDIDLLLLEEFVASPSFGRWFVNHLKGITGDIGKLIDAQRSVTDSTGESDLEITFLKSDCNRIRFLIENKVGAGLQRKQADRYRLRGDSYISKGICSQYYTVIVAPASYFGKSDSLKGFDYRITYEEVLDWFRSAAELGHRSDYKAAMLRAAIDKGTLGYQPVEDAESSSFWYDYWSYSCSYVPELEMPQPKSKPSGATHVTFFPPKLPSDVYLVHKLTNGYVDLEIRNSANYLNQMRAAIGPILRDDMSIVKAGKSSAIRVETPRLNLSVSAQSQSEEIIAGLRNAMSLVAWFTKNEKVLGDYLSNC